MTPTITPSNVWMNEEGVQAAHDEWGFNCGPAALCAVLNMSPEDIRPHLLDFEQKRYTNPTLMANILARIDVHSELIFKQDGRCLRSALKTPLWPQFGLVRIQWDGPWCDRGVPARVRYRHTHWIGYSSLKEGDRMVFDINAINVGGWIPSHSWRNHLVPWLLEQCQPQSNGNWWATHCWEVTA